MKHMLNGLWALSFTPPGEEKQVRMDAQVPGNVEIELEKNGYIDDCIPADTPRASTRFDAVDDWTYTRSFDAPVCEPGWTQELVFEGIDTVADIYLNGEKIAEARDMHMTHRVNVAGRLKTNGNILTVVIRSALMWSRQFEGDILGISRESTVYSGQPYLRKARHEWGWDNAPRLLTSGLYRGVYIESLPPERFDDVYLYTASVTDEAVNLGIVWNYRTNESCLMNHEIRCTLVSKGKTVYSAVRPIDHIRGAERFSVPRRDIALWWPRGFGKPNQCDVELTMLKDGKACAVWTSKWGVRTLRLERTEDILDDNTGEFVFVVNNERVYINGTNWKPLDPLHSRAAEKLERTLDLACDLNCNMIRIWGGGIYEDHDFFDYCDSHGLMVWQDFMFACEFPPRDEWFCRQTAEETTQIIKKLRNHASLAVWCGDNEDDECLTWVNGSSTLFNSHNKINREVLKECVLRHDPYRSYVESSPYASDANVADRRAGHVTHHQPESHLYPATAHFSEALRACRSRFIGETGPIAICAMTGNERIWQREQSRAVRLWNQPLDPSLRNNVMHQTDSYFQTWRQTGSDLCRLWFGRDFSADEWRDYCLAVNIVCGDVFKDVIEYCRTNRWDKTGVIWWSLFDMWPMLFNYSVVDADFVKKMPYYWIRQSQQPFALMAVRRETDGEAALYAANDTLERHCGRYRLTAVGAQGEESLMAMGNYDEAANSSRLIQRLPEKKEPELWIIEWTENGETRFNHFVTGSKHASFEIWQSWTAKLNRLYGAGEDVR